MEGTIKALNPEVFRSEDFMLMSFAAQAMYTQVLIVSDENNVAQYFTLPVNKDAKEMLDAIQELQDKGFIEIREGGIFLIREPENQVGGDLDG